MIRAEQIKLYESYADGILTRNEYLEKKKGLGESWQICKRRFV